MLADIKPTTKVLNFGTGSFGLQIKKKYKELCKRDSDIKLLSDLEKCKDYDDEYVFKK